MQGDLGGLFVELEVSFFGEATSTLGGKLMALDALWRYWTEAQRPSKAAEAALVAVSALRAHPKAWQRAVSLALKARSCSKSAGHRRLRPCFQGISRVFKGF